jgi:hypothetical protein
MTGTGKKILLLTIALAMLAGVVIAQTSPAQSKKKTTTASKPAASTPPLQIDPKAVDILKAASARLSSAKTLSFTAVELFEQLTRQGAPLAYTNKYDATLQRPDKLRVLLTGDAPASDFYIDGTSIIAYAPAANMIAKTDAPSGIEAALEKAFHEAGIYFPFTDFVVADPYADLGPSLKHAYYIGQSSVVGGTITDQIAFVGNGVFAQVWIGADDKLVRMIRAIYLDDPAHLRHELVFTNWQLDQPVTAETFAPANAGNAKSISFANPAMAAARTDKPPVKANSSKQQ